ncbi:MAG: peptidase U32 family protein [Butyricicoccus sp.]
MRNKVELLAPAGSPEGIRAAVQSGAGAVYMGFGMFNARRNAQGFSHDEMADAIAYCRARDVKTNITLNILAGDRELEDALEDAKFLYEAGADALIVQDLGLARLIHAHAPDFALHASTQMTIHTLDAAKQARDIGFSRVVLSRECSREEIKLITEQAGVETEVFVHGALCMCYSGQCYLSAVIGQRSGNRGLCAQPCRLPYSGGYPLSLKDLMLAGHVAELSDWGVSSLKIEGRMKRPEYAAIVTKVYSDLLREHRRPTAEERDILRRVFSRDGFTDGYYTGKLGDSMFGTKTDVPMSEVKKLYDEAAHRFAEGKEAPLVPVSLCFTARKDTGAVLSADGVSVVMPVEQAQNRPTTPEMIEKSLRKTGGTPFYIENMRIEVGRPDDPGVMMRTACAAMHSTFCWQNAALHPPATGCTAACCRATMRPLPARASAATPPRCAPRRRRMRCASLVWRPFTSRLKLRHRPDCPPSCRACSRTTSSRRSRCCSVKP